MALQTVDVSAAGEEVSYGKALRETIVLSELYQVLDKALAAMNVQHLTVLIDEWTSLPTDLQPFIDASLKTVHLRVSRGRENRCFWSTARDSANLLLAATLSVSSSVLTLQSILTYTIVMFTNGPSDQVEDIFRALSFKQVSPGLNAEAFDDHGIAMPPLSGLVSLRRRRRSWNWCAQARV